MDIDVLLEAGLTLGEADLSAAWIATFYTEHNWLFCQFPKALQEKLFAERNYVLAPGAISPGGIAKPVAGGFEVSGRWPWGTGVMHASWVIVGAITEGEAGPRSLRFLALPIEEVEVEDTWFVDGMVGTGSNGMVIKKAFVPNEHSFVVQDLAEGRCFGSELHDAPLYATPMAPVLTLTATCPIVGRVRACVREFRERLLEHKRFMSSGKQSQRPTAQIRLAKATLEIQQAELLLRETVREVMALRNRATLKQRAGWAAAFAHVAHQSRRVLLEISEASGASAHYQKHPLQRAVRDVNTCTGHIVFDLDAQREQYGRLLLGLEPAGGLL